MPGRPRMMLGKVDALSERAGQLADDVQTACPAQYRERAGGGPMGMAWREAVGAALQAQIALTRLQHALYARVHGGEPERAAETLAALEARAAACGPKRCAPPAGAAAGWERLRMAAAGKTSTLAENKAWVNRWLSTPLDDIPAESVPSPEALALLRQALEDTKWFMSLVYSKADGKDIPEGGGGMTPEDMSLDEMLAEFERYVTQAKAAGEL